MSKLDDVTRVVAQKTAALYASGDERKIAMYEALTIEKAIERGESPVEALALVEALRLMGASLSGEERANIHSSDKTVKLKALEENIETNLAASGQSAEERAMTLGVLKQIGTLMAGGGVSQVQGDTITPSHTPNVADKLTQFLVS